MTETLSKLELKSPSQLVQVGDDLVFGLVGHTPDQLGDPLLGPGNQVGGIRLESDQNPNVRQAGATSLGPRSASM